MTKTAILFAGQGAQVVGMGRDVAQAFSAAADVYRRANDVLGTDLRALCFDGPADRLHATEISQPAIFVTSVAIWRALEAAGIAQELAPTAMAGLSLGEYTALHVAGWLDFDDALRLVAERGRLMQRAAETVPGTMVSILGLDEDAVQRLCREAAQGDELTPANFNCPGQIVISGTRAACARAVALAAEFHARATELSVAGAFHSALMSSAARGLEQALARTMFRPSGVRVVSNVTADYHGDPDTVRRLLVEQVSGPVRWQGCVERLIADGYGRFGEIGPGRVLTGLMKKINRSVTVVNYSTAAAFGKVTA